MTNAATDRLRSILSGLEGELADLPAALAAAYQRGRDDERELMVTAYRNGKLDERERIRAGIENLVPDDDARVDWHEAVAILDAQADRPRSNISNPSHSDWHEEGPACEPLVPHYHRKASRIIVWANNPLDAEADR